MLRKSQSPLSGHVRVTFELPSCIWADRIFLAGDFNEWNKTNLPLQQERDGVWRAHVDLEAGKTYEFRYIVDGNWQSDNHADGFNENEHGSDNSIVIAALDSIPIQPEPLPSTISEKSGAQVTRGSKATRLVSRPAVPPSHFGTDRHIGTAA